MYLYAGEVFPVLCLLGFFGWLVGFFFYSRMILATFKMFHQTLLNCLVQVAQTNALVCRTVSVWKQN